ncbi:MAG: hypothetical protein LBC19_08600, partial [Tannerella sp.]|nr:hypothetical protein [Tannerella sp.]
TLFKRLYGVKPVTFEKMLSILQKKYHALYQKGGKPPKLTPEDKQRIIRERFNRSDIWYNKSSEILLQEE